MEALSSSYLIDLLGLAQGVILGLVLIVANKKGRPTLLLGLFLLTYTVEILPSLLSDVGLSEQYFALVSFSTSCNLPASLTGNNTGNISPLE